MLYEILECEIVSEVSMTFLLKLSENARKLLITLQVSHVTILLLFFSRTVNSKNIESSQKTVC